MKPISRKQAALLSGAMIAYRATITDKDFEQIVRFHKVLQAEKELMNTTNLSNKG